MKGLKNPSKPDNVPVFKKVNLQYIDSYLLRILILISNVSALMTHAPIFVPSEKFFSSSLGVSMLNLIQNISFEQLSFLQCDFSLLGKTF